LVSAFRFDSLRGAALLENKPAVSASVQVDLGLFYRLTEFVGDGASIVARPGAYWSGFVYHIFLASEISMLGTSMPLLMNFASTHSLSTLQLGMIWPSPRAAVMYHRCRFGRIQMKSLLSSAVIAAVLGAPHSARAQAEVTLVASGGIRAAVEQLIPGFERKTGYKVKATFGSASEPSST
jgi:hypothetical protein